MPLQLTLDLFSGRPNPTVRLSSKESAELLARLRPAKALPRVETPPPPVLGYRGMIIEQVGRPARTLPRTFRAVAGRLYGEKLSAPGRRRGLRGGVPGKGRDRQKAGHPRPHAGPAPEHGDPPARAHPVVAAAALLPTPRGVPLRPDL